jgi:hypothetical protein
MIVFLFDNLTKVTGINADNLMRETKRHKKNWLHLLVIMLNAKAQKRC